MRTVQRIRKKGNGTRLVAVPPAEEPTALEARVALIQALIPLGLEAVAEELTREVVALAGERHARAGRRPGLVRWGRQQGSVSLADQKRPVVGPRVRDRHRQVEVPLANVSAAKSLAEGLEETLTLHRLGLFAELGASFKTTNPLESIMAQVEHRTAKVDHWRTSEQTQRWCAAALLLIEPRLRKVKGYRHLQRLAEALRTANRTQVDVA